MTKQLSQTALYGEILTNEQQLRVDLQQIQRLTPEQEQELLHRLLNGDQQAREDMIRGFAGYIQWKTSRLFSVYRWASCRIEYLDLFQEGVMALLETLERALQKENPIAYLYVVIARRMYDYCRRNASLIVTPSTPEQKREEEGYLQPFLQVESIDAPLPSNKNTDFTLSDVLVAEGTENQEEKDFSLLYQAIDTLTMPQREVVKRHYGLDGAPEDLYTLSCDIHEKQGKPHKRGESIAYSIHKGALSSLQRKLTEPTLLEPSFPCPQCGKTILRQGARSSKRYCSQKCVLRASRQKRRQEQQSA